MTLNEARRLAKQRHRVQRRDFAEHRPVLYGPRQFAGRRNSTQDCGETLVKTTFGRLIAALGILALATGIAAAQGKQKVTIAVGGAMGLLVVLFMRPLYIEFGPVRTLYERVTRWAT